jgi:hypothetical protein
MKRRSLLQMASASVAGLLFPAWLFSSPSRRLVVPGWGLSAAARRQRIHAIYSQERLCPEVPGHNLAIQKAQQRNWKDMPLLQQTAEGNLPPDAGFTDGPPLVLGEPERAATAEETQEFINQWVRSGAAPKANPVSIEEAQAIADGGTLDDYLFATKGRDYLPAGGSTTLYTAFGERVI